MKTAKTTPTLLRHLVSTLVTVVLAAPAVGGGPIAVADDPLVRMPGTQPGEVTLDSAATCFGCHSGFDPVTEPAHGWQGSMMSQAARDPLFWAALAVAAQDSLWLTAEETDVSRPNATDMCLRCHMPKGWLEERSDPPNGSAMEGADFDGVQCDFCHQMVDPFFEDTFDGSRESSDWAGYWDETPTDPGGAASDTRTADSLVVASHEYFNGDPFYGGDDRPDPIGYTENASGQYVIDPDGSTKRASFADANAPHSIQYSRYHRSRFFCSTCHDVSNPVLANLADHATLPGEGSPLPTEIASASSYGHVERTFSEMMLSAFGLGAGAPGTGAFAPDVFDTSRPGNAIASCQDCHMPDVSGVACSLGSAVDRPSESIIHPKSGVPQHDLTGANVLISRILASAVPGSPNYDATNEDLLDDVAELTLDLNAGLGIDPEALLDGADRALQNLQDAATIEAVSFNGTTGDLTFRIVNHTGHKLITGYPEGRRMWVNVRVWDGATLLHEVNPYDETADTLKGLGTPSSPPLGPDESYDDALVYEMRASSSLTGESHTMHFILGTEREKDNRIPPRGFRIAEAAARQSEPVWNGTIDPAYFTAAEYAGGYDESTISLPTGGEGVEIRLFYQTTSREYIEFLRDEICGDAVVCGSGTQTLPASAYVIQTDPFFTGLKAWGQVIWDLWDHNRDVPGAAPILMTEAMSFPIFVDGFESGDTGAWSSSTP